MGKYSIESPEILQIADGDRLCFGANQEWYPKIWQRLSGCGPTNASHLAWYLAETRSGCKSLAGYPAGTKEGFCLLMNEMWRCVTPGSRGVNGTGMFAEGLRKYASERGFSLALRVMDIDSEHRARPDEGSVAEFLADAMQNDRPVAFLNLNNGAEKRLDRWHWVTLISFDSDTFFTGMYDQNKSSVIDLSLWLRTTTIGGGFVTADIAGR